MEVALFGQTLKLRSGENESYVKALAGHIDRKILEIAKGSRHQQDREIALLAALNIADELFKARSFHESFKRRVRQKSAEMLSLVEKQLKQV